MTPIKRPTKHEFNQSVARRGKPFVLFVSTLIGLIIASAPISIPAYTQWSYDNKVNSLEYKQQYGHWEVIELPEEFRLNTIHAATLPTGKILLVAGSGNNRENFDSYSQDGVIQVLKTALFDPETNTVKHVETPSDLFCAGHAFLQDGNLLVAGGTSGYEVLQADVTRPGGAMILHNEDPDSLPRTFAAGTRFVSPEGKAYRSTEEVMLYPAHKMDQGQGNVVIHPSSAKVFVEAVSEDASYVTTEHLQYSIEGLSGSDMRNIYGQGGPMTYEKQDFRGDEKSYEFDPITEKYVRVGDMNESRWYASLPVMTDGTVLAVSGLDNTGIITETTELYDPNTKSWAWGPDRAFPTYPALFRTPDPNVLFFSGSNAGYGPADKGREPGFWNVSENTFSPVSGLRYPHIVETSASVMLPPKKGSNDGSQSWRVMIAGGGGIGESPLVTDRTDILDLTDAQPRYIPGPNLPAPLRYVNTVVTPWDEIFMSGGTGDYRAKGNSYSYQSISMNPTDNSITQLADSRVGRSYHSGALLLKDGRVLVFGSDPLYADTDNTQPGSFEQRLEIFTPPQFFRGERPSMGGEDMTQVARGETLQYRSSHATAVRSARLIPLNSSTHVTNIEQRSVAAKVSVDSDELTVELPNDTVLLPDGWYMLFVVDEFGVPSVAKMVQVAR